MSTKEIQVVNKLNEAVSSVIGSDKLQGFERAFKIASAAQELKLLLTHEYMVPIMALQNSKLGFRTDREEGYSEDVVKNCLIEAVLTGVEPFGNQFNIIAGNCYITKEGFGHLLKNYPGLDCDIVPSLPRINSERTSAAIVMLIEWTINGETKKKEIDFAIRMNKMMGVDAVVGKATRKARAWLFWRINGIEVSEGDVNDVDVKVVSSTIQKSKEEIERERIVLLINDAKSVDELNSIAKHVPDELLDLFTVRMDELEAK